jgi:hypothetical protein
VLVAVLRRQNYPDLLISIFAGGEPDSLSSNFQGVRDQGKLGIGKKKGAVGGIGLDFFLQRRNSAQY